MGMWIVETKLGMLFEFFFFLIQFHSCGLRSHSWDLVLFRVISNRLTFAIEEC
jgi:hypothetical protein